MRRPELTELAIRRRRQKEIGAEQSTSWPDALKAIENQAVLKFFRQELEAGRQSSLKYRALRFYVGNKRRFSVWAKREWASVRQYGRFDDDVEFWTARLGDQAKIKIVGGGRHLRFSLFDEAAFEKFKHAVSVELLNTEFHGTTEDDADEVEQAAA